MGENKPAGEKAAAETKFIDEFRKMKQDEILPVEKKLVGWSLVLGVVLIVLLALLNQYIFPA
jgi:hypothetical protein